MPPEVIAIDNKDTITGTKIKVLYTVLYICIPGDNTSSHALYKGLLLSGKSLCQVAKYRISDMFCSIL